MPAPDPEVIRLLEEMSFHRTDIGPYRAFMNRPGWGRPQAVLAFSRRYPTIEAAQRAEILIDLYTRGALKGTREHPTEDRLTRAYREAHTTPPAIGTNRQEELLTLCIGTHYPEGKYELRSTAQTSNLTAAVLRAPRLLDDGTLLERVRAEAIDEIDDRIQDHVACASYRFQQRFFPMLSPVTEEQERQLVQDASAGALSDAFTAHVRESHPTLLYAGGIDHQSIGASFAPLLAITPTPVREEDVLATPRIRMLAPGDPIGVEGPSQQTQHLRAYPLAAVPTDPIDIAALEIATHSTGGGWTGKLMQIIREQHHLVYGIDAQLALQRNAIIVGTEHDPAVRSRIAELTDGIFADTAAGRLTDTEIENAREEILQGSIITHAGGGVSDCTQPTVRLGDAYARHVAKTQRTTPLERYRALATITPERIRETAHTYLAPLRCQEFTYGTVSA